VPCFADIPIDVKRDTELRFSGGNGNRAGLSVVFVDFWTETKPVVFVDYSTEPNKAASDARYDDDVNDFPIMGSTRGA